MGKEHAKKEINIDLKKKIIAHKILDEYFKFLKSLL